MTEPCSRYLVGFDVLPANGLPIVSASARPRASAIGGDAHGVTQNASAAKKRNVRMAMAYFTCFRNQPRVRFQASFAASGLCTSGRASLKNAWVAFG